MMTAIFVVAVVVGIFILISVAKTAVKWIVVAVLLCFAFFMWKNNWSVKDSINDTKTTITDVGTNAIDKAKSLGK